GYPRTRILFGSMDVSAVRHLSSATRGCARRSAWTGSTVLPVCASFMLPSRETEPWWRPLCAVEPVPEIAKTRNDELMVVQSFIDDRRVDMNIGMMLLDERKALRCGDDADHPDGARACALQEVERGDGASPRCQHGIDHEDERARQVRRKLRIILRGDRRELIALKPDMAHAGRRDQLEHGIEHAESSAQNRHDDYRVLHAASFRRTERCLNTRRNARHIARRLGGEGQAYSDGHPAEQLARRRRITERRERVVHERVLDDVDRHGVHYTKGERKREKGKAPAAAASERSETSRSAWGWGPARIERRQAPAAAR